MADALYLSLWFSDFEREEVLPHALTVMRQFSFSAQKPGISYLAIHPVSWNEATVLERRFEPPGTVEAAILAAADFLHEDYAYVFEAAWDLWQPSTTGDEWLLRPAPVKFIARGLEFGEGEYEQEGHIQIDFGADSLFLYEELKMTQDVESRVRSNVHKLVEYSAKLEQSSGATARLLWSESEENLAQKLITRLQRVQ
jgi:hypothetical protein